MSKGKGKKKNKGKKGKDMQTPWGNTTSATTPVSHRGGNTPGYHPCNHWQEKIQIGDYTIFASGLISNRNRPAKASHVGFYLDADWMEYLDVELTNSIRYSDEHDVGEVVLVPWPDFGDTAPERYSRLVHRVKERLERGDSVVVGCLGGHGRTGTVIAGVLALVEQLSARAAIRELRARYCDRCVETLEQQEMVFDLLGEEYDDIITRPAPKFSYPVKTYAVANGKVTSNNTTLPPAAISASLCVECGGYKNSEDALDSGLLCLCDWPQTPSGASMDEELRQIAVSMGACLRCYEDHDHCLCQEGPLTEEDGVSQHPFACDCRECGLRVRKQITDISLQKTELTTLEKYQLKELSEIDSTAAVEIDGIADEYLAGNLTREEAVALLRSLLDSDDEDTDELTADETE